MTSASTIYERPEELLQNLIRFDTTNPPGNEEECIRYINDLLTKAGFETTLLPKVPKRPNLITRLKGKGEAPPLLMYGHADVVTTADQEWLHPPFEGNIIDGIIWGRGTLDMKGALAMMISALMRAKAEGLTPPGDVILAVVSDEEGGGDVGAKFLTEEHAHQFEGVRYAIGEAGGFNMEIGGKKFYPIQVAEKQICWLKAKLHGTGGHGSMPVKGGAIAKLGHMLQQLDNKRLPIHITPPVQAMFNGLADHLSFPTNFMLKQILNPLLTDLVINLLGERARLFAPLVRNTVSPSILHASEKVNVIPSLVELEMDGRLLPGFGPDDMIAELQAIVGEDVVFEVVRHDPCPAAPDMGLFDTLGNVLIELDADAIPVPMLLPAVTDARFFYQLGIQTYGFTPMQLPAELNFTHLAHGANERIPVAGLKFGAEAVFKLLNRFHV